MDTVGIAAHQQYNVFDDLSLLLPHWQIWRARQSSNACCDRHCLQARN